VDVCVGDAPPVLDAKQLCNSSVVKCTLAAWIDEAASSADDPPGERCPGFTTCGIAFGI